jgi:hypothetical protein
VVATSRVDSRDNPAFRSDGVLEGVVLSVWGCAVASQWDDTRAETADVEAGLVGGRPAEGLAGPENDAEVNSVVDFGGRIVGNGEPERGDQDSTGDEDLEGRQRIASGDAGSQPAGQGPTAVGGGSGGGSVSESPAGPRPVTPIRASQLGELANEVGHDTGIVERFVVDFLTLLDQRLAAVREALADCDTDGAVTVLRSLETTGAMLGAEDLVAATTALRQAVRDDPGRVDQKLREFLGQAEALRVRLTSLSSALARRSAGGSGQSGSASR